MNDTLVSHAAQSDAQGREVDPFWARAFGFLPDSRMELYSFCVWKYHHGRNGEGEAEWRAWLAEQETVVPS